MPTSILTFVFFALLAAPQQSKPETVAIVFGPDPERIVIMKRDQAEDLYAMLEESRQHAPLNDLGERLHAALTAALGISPTQETAPLLNTRDRLDWEIRRGVHKPLQKPGRDN